MLQEVDTLVLNPQVLTQLMRWRRDLLGLRNQPIPDLNRAMRFAAYTQHTFMRYGYLGPDNRRAVPSCVVWRVRDAFPDPLGNYVDFIPSRYRM